MATREELEQKINKLEVNMNRTDRIVNGGEDEDVLIDGGQLVPSIRKWQKELGEEYGFPQELVQQAEDAADRAEDATDRVLEVPTYTSGLELTSYNQLIRDSNGEFWRVSGQVDLPYVTTGAGIPEDDALVPAGDAVLRQELASPGQGSDLVAHTGTSNTVTETLDRHTADIDQRTINVDESISLTVGSGGDYSTINEALEFLSKRSANITGSATILLLSGFIMSEQIFLRGIDLSWIEIVSEDAEVPIQRSSLTTQLDSPEGVAGPYYPAFSAYSNASLPVISTLFNMDSSGTASGRVGIIIEGGSFGFISEGAGVKNAGEHGLRVSYGSRAVANGSIFTGAVNRGCMVLVNSSASINGADFSGALGRNTLRVFRSCVVNARGANLSNGAEVNVRVSEASLLDLQGANCSGAGQVNSENSGQGVVAFGGAIVYADGINASGCAGSGLEASTGAVIIATIGADCSGSGKYGLYARDGGRIQATTVDATNCQDFAVRADTSGEIDCSGGVLTGSPVGGINVVTSGFVRANDCTANGLDYGARVTRGGRLSCDNANFSGSATAGIELFWGGHILSADGTDVSGNRTVLLIGTTASADTRNVDAAGCSTNGINGFRGTQAHCFGINASKGGSDSPHHIRVLSGSIRHANEAIGGTNVAENAISAAGIIFRT